MKDLYRIARDEKRLIGGYDVLATNYRGLNFTHPTLVNELNGESIFEADLETCKTICKALDNCFVVTQDGKKVRGSRL